MAGGNWNTGHFQLDQAHIWFDGTDLRGKNSAPASASDGFKLDFDTTISRTWTDTHTFEEEDAIRYIVNAFYSIPHESVNVAEAIAGVWIVEE